MRRLPPLAAVRVFEAAARHENFTSAAAELGMTQAAVSYQIKLLEERLGAPLFRREKRRVVLTDAGRRAAAPITRAFDAIDSAFAAIRAEDASVLTVSTSNTFANTWLAWRLGSFQMAHPEMAVRLLTSDAIADFASDDVDVAIRSGLGGWDGLVAEKIVPIDFTPMCSPGFLDRYGPFEPKPTCCACRRSARTIRGGRSGCARPGSTCPKARRAPASASTARRTKATPRWRGRGSRC